MLRRSTVGILSRSFHYNTCSPKPISLFLLETLTSTTSFTHCKQLHASLLTSGFLAQTFLANTLLNHYSRFGDLDGARLLFDEMPDRNVVSWTTLISAYVHHGHAVPAIGVFKEMLGTDERPNEFTLSIAIRACSNLGIFELGLQIHGLIVLSGFENDKYAGSSLVDMYSKSGGCVSEAYRVFSGLYVRDIVVWNAMISAFAKVGDYSKVSEMLSGMRNLNRLNLNDFTLASLLKCCGVARQVEQIHGLAVKTGIEFDSVVSGALIDTYCKCGDLDSGRKQLHLTQKKDGFIWSSIISGYARNGVADEAILLFKDMRREDMLPDQHALSGALKACAETGDLQVGVQLHTQTVKCGYQSNCIVASVLLTLYANCSRAGEGKLLFDRIYEKDLVAWNSMLLCYAEMECNSAFFTIMLFREFCLTSLLKPDAATFIALLKSCRSDEDLVVGTQFHARIVKSSHQFVSAVGNAIIYLYSKCAVVDYAFKAFCDMNHKDDVTWSSMISSYQQHGFELEALNLCKQMMAHGIGLTTYSLPSSVTACSELASIHVGRQLHSALVKSGLHGDVYTGSSFIDMYAKCGNIEDARLFFNEQKKPNEVTFNALISGFAHHGQAQEAIAAFHEMEKKNLSPNQVTFLALLTACSHGGHLEDSLNFFDIMVQRYHIKPETEHFSCLVDVFGRAGRLEEALQIIELNSGPSAWRTLLSACKNHGNYGIAELSAEKLLKIDPRDHTSYILLSNLFSGGGKWQEAFRVRKKMENAGVK